MFLTVFSRKMMKIWSKALPFAGIGGASGLAALVRMARVEAKIVANGRKCVKIMVIDG